MLAMKTRNELRDCQAKVEGCLMNGHQMVFPFSPRQSTAVDFFLAQDTKAGNMYATGKKICPWYAATMTTAAQRAGKYEKVLPLVRAAAASSGCYGEIWEINEPGVAEFRPWFMTAAGNCLYVMNQMLLAKMGGERRIGAGVPKEWKDWSFRLPSESGYEVDFAMKGGKVVKLVLRTRRIAPARRVRVLLPDGLRREASLGEREVSVVTDAGGEHRLPRMEGMQK